MAGLSGALGGLGFRVLGGFLGFRAGLGFRVLFRGFFTGSVEL